MLSPEQLDARKGKITASRVACLMTADEPAILNMWRGLVEDPGYHEEDLSDVWPVQLGSATEELNLRWFELRHGAVSRRGEVVVVGWAATTLDGWSDDHECPVECKHVGGREPLDTVVERYQPQMHWQMIVTGARQCALSVIEGANAPIVEFIDYDETYGKELWARATALWLCVQTKTAPVSVPAMRAPVKAEKIYCMEGRNQWASAAAAWLENRIAKQIATDAERELKGLVPEDAALCHGHLVSIRRDRAGRLSLRRDQA